MPCLRRFAAGSDGAATARTSDDRLLAVLEQFPESGKLSGVTADLNLC
jgi:hypothetical protein